MPFSTFIEERRLPDGSRAFGARVWTKLRGGDSEGAPDLHRIALWLVPGRTYELRGHAIIKTPERIIESGPQKPLVFMRDGQTVQLQLKDPQIAR